MELVLDLSVLRAQATPMLAVTVMTTGLAAAVVVRQAQELFLLQREPPLHHLQITRAVPREAEMAEPENRFHGSRLLSQQL
jgi:hypothetical protein